MKTHRNPVKPILTQWNPIEHNRNRVEPSQTRQNLDERQKKIIRNNRTKFHQRSVHDCLFFGFFFKFYFQVGAGRNRRATQFVQGLFHAATLPPLIPTDKAINTHQSRPSRSPIFFFVFNCFVALLFLFAGNPLIPEGRRRTGKRTENGGLAKAEMGSKSTIDRYCIQSVTLKKKSLKIFFYESLGLV